MTETIVENQKRKKRKENFLSFLKALGVGVVEGGIIGGIGILIIQFNALALFSTVAIWLIFGWFSEYFIKQRTLEILTLLISSNIFAATILFIGRVQIWFLSILIGISIISWIIGYTTKIFVFPRKSLEKDQDNELKN